MTTGQDRFETFKDLLRSEQCELQMEMEHENAQLWRATGINKSVRFFAIIGTHGFDVFIEDPHIEMLPTVNAIAERTLNIPATRHPVEVEQ